MTPNKQHLPQSTPQPGARRVRWLVATLALAAVACALIAVIAGGSGRALFGGAALVLAVAAIWSGIEMATFKPSDPQFDLEGPPPATALPQSPVTQTYDPAVSPDTSLGRTREGASV
jgi:hypothetical protein